MEGRDGINAFSFQTGKWSVGHRKLKRRLVGETEWLAFEGSCEAWEILGGAGNVDDHWLEDPSGPYAAATIRRLEPDGRWSIWWIDPRFPGLDSPMHGSFANGVGTFHGEDVLNGRPIHVRFIWSHITANSARWEQAFSADKGATYETNWVMEFERAA